MSFSMFRKVLMNRLKGVQIDTEGENPMKKRAYVERDHAKVA